MSAWELIGGANVIAEAVERFYERLQADPVLGVHFERSDVAQLTTHQTMFLTLVLGGPDAYEGRDMRAAHAHLPITDADFDLFVDHLADTLRDFGASPERISELREALQPLRLEIVTAPGEGADEWGAQDPSGGSG